MKRTYPPGVFRRNQGVALLIVLGSLIFISAIILAFLASTNTENQASYAYSNGSSVKLLAELPVNIVETQIKTATSEVDSAGSRTAWASQPGMIRTFDTVGKLAHAYKLYSSDNINPTTINVGNEVQAIPTTWYTQTSLFTDLNEPVVTDPGNGTTAATRQYPILDPVALDAPVEGLKIAGAPVKSSNNEDRAPMPVKWLYVLKNAQVVTPTAGSTAGSAGAITVTGATQKNPIVARIAYWADDETAKINVNTAAGDELNNPSTTPGSFWDTPRFNSAYENKLSSSIPVMDEYQRFPGSPATVYLAEAFKYKSSSGLTRAQVAAIAPRIGTGGTQGGTISVTGGGGSNSSTNPNPMTLDADRLYSSIDELLFKNPAANDTTRTVNNPLTKADLQNTKFVLTAQSRAPEVNLFNMPRISMWPLSGIKLSSQEPDLTYLSPFDKLIRQCTTISTSAGTSNYYFQRVDSTSPTADAALNGDLYGYLDYLTKTKIPGFNGKFSDKYPSYRTQLMAEILDYIRCTNLYDSYLISGTNDTKAYTHQLNVDWAGVGQVTPMVIGGKMGFGRFSTISEAGVVISDEADIDTSGAASVPLTKVGFPPPSPPLAAGEKIIQAAWVMEPFCVSEGFPVLGNNLTITVSGLDNIKIRNPTGTYIPLFKAGSFSQVFDRAAGKITKDGGSNTGGVGDIRNLANYTSHPIGSAGPYQFLGPAIKVRGNLVVLGGAVTMTISAGTGTNAVPVQTIILDFPGSTFPSPTFPPGPVTQHSFDYRLSHTQGASTNATPSVADIDSWITAASGTSTNYSGQSYETVRTMAVATSDIRQAALLPSINNATDKIYAPGVNFTNINQKNSGVLQFGNHEVMAGDDYGSYIPLASNGQYPLFKYLKRVPTGQTDYIKTGDYENGVAIYNDGAYINRPDEGANADNGAFINYFADYKQTTNLSKAFFSPNRQIPSSGMLGSLPATTGPSPTAPWSTLLFRPQPGHPNSSDPKDYLLMDLFWMPIVEPYAISEPFSTAGKINLNQQIMPFSYITRTTALEAAIEGENYLALPVSVANGYKGYSARVGNYRTPLDAQYILKQMNARFSSSDIYRTAAEICDLDLAAAAAPNNYDEKGSYNATSLALTGDSSRERPYTNLYQKLTTKSNTYTVHYRVQQLKEVPAGRSATSGWDSWNESTDKVLSEYRGATLIERYVDPNDTSIPDYLRNPSGSQPIDNFYKFRVVSSKQFAP